MAYSCACRQLYKTVSLYNQQAYRIELVLGAIRPQIILKFQTDSCRTILYLWWNHQFPGVSGNNRHDNSGSTAVQFFNCDIYANLDLDVYVEHQDAEFQTLEMGLDTSSDFRMVDPFGMTTLMDGPQKGYFDVVAILDFEKVNCPNIQLATSRGPPLEIVLNFYSSECSNYCFSKKYICSTNAQHVLWI